MAKTTKKKIDEMYQYHQARVIGMSVAFFIVGGILVMALIQWLIRLLG
jgi:hypothetical protein